MSSLGKGNLRQNRKPYQGFVWIASNPSQNSRFHLAICCGDRYLTSLCRYYVKLLTLLDLAVRGIAKFVDQIPSKPGSRSLGEFLLAPQTSPNLTLVLPSTFWALELAISLRRLRHLANRPRRILQQVIVFRNLEMLYDFHY